MHLSDRYVAAWLAAARLTRHERALVADVCAVALERFERLIGGCHSAHQSLELAQPRLQLGGAMLAAIGFGP